MAAQQASTLRNARDIYSYLKTFTGQSQELSALLTHALAGPLKKHSSSQVPLIAANKNWPESLKQKFEDSTQLWVHFIPNEELDRHVRLVRDWLAQSLINDEAWLYARDEKQRPTKITRIQCVEDAVQEALDYFNKKPAFDERLSALQSEWAGFIQEQTGRIETVMQLSDNYRIVRLLDESVLKREGHALKHCMRHDDANMANAPYRARVRDKDKKWHYYSLRDKHNNPRATIEIDRDNGIITQCRGALNIPPSKYLPYVIDFIEQQQLGTSNICGSTGLIQQDGQFWNIYTLPDNFTVYGDYSLEGCKTDPPLPKRIYGDLNISGSRIVNLNSVEYVSGKIIVGPHADDSTIYPPIICTDLIEARQQLAKIMRTPPNQTPAELLGGYDNPNHA